MKPIAIAAGVASYWSGAAITMVIIDLVGKGSTTLPFVIGSVLGSQLGVVAHHRQAGSKSSLNAKLVLGVALAFAALAFGFFVHLVLVPYTYPEISIPLAMLGGAIFPFVLFNTMWNALSKRREA